MGQILTNKQINEIVKEVKTFRSQTRIDFLDVDYEDLGNALRSGPAQKYLPQVTGDNLFTVDCQNGNCILTLGEKSKSIPQQMLPLVSYSTLNLISGISDKRFEQILWEYLEKIIRWVLEQKHNLTDQTRQILKDADRTYIKLREKISAISKEYDDDNTFDFLLFLPDYFILMLRLLADREVSKEVKVAIIFGVIYFVSPIDLIPERFIAHPLAFTDDAAVIIMIFKYIVDGKHVSKEKLEQHWPGKITHLDSINEWLIAIENVLGKKYLKKLFDYMKQKISEEKKVKVDKNS